MKAIEKLWESFENQHPKGSLTDFGVWLIKNDISGQAVEKQKAEKKEIAIRERVS